MKHFTRLSRRTHISVIVVILALLIGAIQTAKANPSDTFIIDHFNTDQSMTLTWAGSSYTQVDALTDSTALGGERDIFTGISGGDTDQTILVTTNSGGNSRFDFTSGTNVVGFTEVQYDGNNATTDSPKSVIDVTNGLGAAGNLTRGGTTNALVVGMTFNDQGAPLIVQFWQSSTRCTQRSITTGHIDSLNTKLFVAPLNTTSSSGNVASPCAANHVNDWTVIKAVVIRVNTGSYAGSDFSMHLVALVRAPYMDYGDLPNDGSPADGLHGLYDTDQDFVTGTDVYARHLIRGGYLGTTVTAEASKASLPDDNNVAADTDEGVTPTGTWTPGLAANGYGGHVDATVGGCATTCYLTAFIDWNGDGNFYYTSDIGAVVWDDGEKVLSDATVTNGTQTLNFDIPSSTAGGALYARFRITDEDLGRAGSPWGTYYSGEVEDYAWDAGLDFGDLPEPGSTGDPSYSGLVQLPNGARHTVGMVNSLTLGTIVDTETNGNQSHMARGDDFDATDDEDGVTTNKASWGDFTYGLANVYVGGGANLCSGTVLCYVAGWIDWNKDGQLEVGEKIIDGSAPADPLDMGNTLYPIQFTIPSTITFSANDIYYARFRLCGGVGGAGYDCSTPGGFSASGEVEDYYLVFDPLSVNLASFTAAKASDHNALAWETASELKNLGFNVWRGTSASAPDVKLNEFVIPSQAPGGTDGFAYSYNDFDIAGGINYYYWLEDVDLNGTVTRHGPVQATAGSGDSPTAVTLTALQGNSSTSALPWVAFGMALLAGVGVVVGRRRS